jgi:glycosyltransferase involved in cell wall biosynthesis
MTTISCIIPTLNRGTVLVETIRQLLTQKCRASEIILVDQTPRLDPATEGALNAWREQGVIEWIRQSEPNASKARNAGALAASGEILLFLDDDIQIAPDFVEAHARNYRDPDVVAVAGQVLETERTTTTQLQYPPDDPEVGWIRFPKNYANRCVTTWMASGNFSVRREVYFEVGGMDENYKRGAFREESDFAMRFLKKGYRFQFDPEASVVHLGARLVSQGGARSWSQVFCWHHCLGDWYFTIKYGTRRNLRTLICFGFRHLVASRKNVTRPWTMPVAASCWLGALPVAVLLRCAGSRLIKAATTSSAMPTFAP